MGGVPRCVVTPLKIALSEASEPIQGDFWTSRRAGFGSLGNVLTEASELV